LVQCWLYVVCSVCVCVCVCEGCVWSMARTGRPLVQCWLYVVCSVCVWRLRMKHGSDWASIGAMLGRSASSVKDRYRLMKETCNSGAYSHITVSVAPVYTSSRFVVKCHLSVPLWTRMKVNVAAAMYCVCCCRCDESFAAECDTERWMWFFMKSAS